MLLHLLHLISPHHGYSRHWLAVFCKFNRYCVEHRH